MTSRHLLSGILLALLIATPATQATVIGWEATLDQAQEIPAPIPVAGAGGSAFGTIDTITGLLTWNLSFSGLSGPATGIHFHGAAPVGATAGVRVNIGGISGLGSPSNGSTTISTTHAGELLAGLWYINVHTALNPPGEIRGQVTRVPEPSTIALIGLGLLGVMRRFARAA